MYYLRSLSPSFFFNDPATTEIYTLSLHDALPISERKSPEADTDVWYHHARAAELARVVALRTLHSCNHGKHGSVRSEEHTSELQSHHDLVCRLLLEKKKKKEETKKSHTSREHKQL